MWDWEEDKVNPVAPSKEQRIAAHRAPTRKDRIRFGILVLKQVWKVNPVTVLGVAFGMVGWVILIGVFIWGMIELIW